MDSRIYFHQYRRPRYNNPTYVSTNINQSITFFEDKAYKNYDSYLDNQIGQERKAYSLNKDKFTTIGTPNERMNPIDVSNQPRNQSNLSSYGINSLSLNQNDIFNKQNAKFNIITMKPK